MEQFKTDLFQLRKGGLMSARFEPNVFSSTPFPNLPNSNSPRTTPMLAPVNAWRILCARTGGEISRATFYRWLSSGRLYSIRVGTRIYIPWPELDRAIRQCLAGERL
jgi:excisionase family DNA binding protein